MPTSSVDTLPVPAPTPPPAYPNPIHLPVAPHGDPAAAHHLATAYRTLADHLDTTTTHLDAITTDLATRWHGHGATTLHLPTHTLHDNLRTLAAAYRSAADHLDDYANALHKAQHHHGWSLSTIIAIGAVVTITTAAIVVTVGAAAPAGTLAATEVGEAILGAETAAAGATAAETTATEGLTLAGHTMTTLRGLVAVALPHLTQGAINTGIDAGLHLATGHPITAHQVELDFLTGTLTAATTTATRSALHATQTYADASTLAKTALDTTAITTTLTTDTALQQYATTGHLNPTTLTKNALLDALTGAAATLRHPLNGTNAIARPRFPALPPKIRPPSAPAPIGVDPVDMAGGPGDLWAHEGPGHTIQKHVGLTDLDLRAWLAREPNRDAVSSFPDVETAEKAIRDVLRRHPTDYTGLLAGDRRSTALVAELPYDCGVVLTKYGARYIGKEVTVVLIVVNHRIVVRTAYVE